MLASYLGRRSQYVVYGGAESARGRVECGDPQGFLIYVNDVVRVGRDLDFVLFADDTNIFVVLDSVALDIIVLGIIVLDLMVLYWPTLQHRQVPMIKLDMLGFSLSPFNSLSPSAHCM